MESPRRATGGGELNTETSKRLFDEAQRYIPGGVNSPVRAMKGVGMPHPLFIARARGAPRLGRRRQRVRRLRLVVGAHDPRLGPPRGRRPPARSRSTCGTSFGAPTELEVELARLICEARAVGRARAHGQLGHRGHDERRARGPRLHRAREGRQVHRLLPRPRGRVPGGGRQRRAHAGAARQPRRHQGDDGRHAARRVQRRRGARRAVRRARRARSPRSSSSRWPATWASCRRSRASSRRARELCTRHGALLIFDEVITGFRVAWGGAQERYGVMPDLTTLGKIIGGGLPVGAFGGRRDIMETVAPLGSTYQAGTLSGNPLAMAAGIATLRGAGRARRLRAPRGRAGSSAREGRARPPPRRPRRSPSTASAP